MALVDALIEQHLGGEPDDFEWMWNDSQTPANQEQKELFNFHKRFKKQCTVLKDIRFPVTDESSQWNYQKLICCILKLHFSRCHFYGKRLLDSLAVSTADNECVFHADWEITAAQNIDDSGALFSQCHFKKTVELLANERGMNPLMGYDTIFSGCELSRVVLNGLILDIPLFDQEAPVNTPMSST